LSEDTWSAPPLETYSSKAAKATEQFFHRQSAAVPHRPHSGAMPPNEDKSSFYYKSNYWKSFHNSHHRKSVDEQVPTLWAGVRADDGRFRHRSSDATEWVEPERALLRRVRRLNVARGEE
jgi:hypothetical protein